jgi:3,4-dihydroxy 2-butanone 4-phosphate synthase / GTP cyclohydrolase II
VERVAEVQLPTPQGVFRGIAYRDRAGMTHHLAIVSTASPVSSEVLVRVQAECLAGEVFGSRRCSCGADLARSLELLASEGGVFVYLTDAAERARVDRHGADGAAPPPLDYLPAVQILADLGVTAMRLLTHDGTVPAALAEQGIPVTSAVALRPMSDKAAAAH